MGGAEGAAIDVRQLSVTIGERSVLRDISFSVRRGELVTVVGENGAGKSTLAACLSGIHRPASGRVEVLGQPAQAAFRSGRLATVWQDPALCNDMTATDNLFLGREVGGVFLQRRRMRQAARRAFDELGLPLPNLARPAVELSVGQRQLLALVGAMMRRPRILVLDEPTSALGVAELAQVEALLRRLRAAGVTVVLISHRVEQVASLADRVLALRHGRLVADTTTVELTTDDLVALMSGIESGSAARRHLTQLSGLVDQLADHEPSASIPLIVSAIATALGQQQLCVHLVDAEDRTVLRLRAEVGLSDAARDTLQRVAVTSPMPVGTAFRSGRPQVREGASTQREPAESVSMWSVPILGSGEVYGVVSGLADVPGRPQADQLEVVSVYARLAAAAIERERLLGDLSRHNSMLEALRRVLDRLTGPTDHGNALRAALGELRTSLGAVSVALFQDGGANLLESVEVAESGDAVARQLPRDELGRCAEGTVQLLDRHTAAVVVPTEIDRLVLVTRWRGEAAGEPHQHDLMRNAAWSLALSVQRERAEESMAEATVLARTSAVQREFVRRLSHELRTPLTTIFGYASTLRQPDVTWDQDAHRRFTEVIYAESARMHRLVMDLLDSSTLAAGRLPMVWDWCDLPVVVETAIGAMGGRAARIRTDLGPTPTIWADHDRLTQVLVNLLDNAFRHGAAQAAVCTTLVGPGRTQVRIEVSDDGPGVGAAPEVDLFQPYTSGATHSPGLGLGLSITAGIVEAHGGTIALTDGQRGAVATVHLPVEPPPGSADGSGCVRG